MTSSIDRKRAERSFLLDLVEEDNVRVHEEEEDDGWVTYHVADSASGPLLSIEYTSARTGEIVSADFILVAQIGNQNG